MINWPTLFPTLPARSESKILVNLRPLNETDIDPIFQACQDPTIPAFTRVPSPYERSMAEEFVRESDVAYRNHVSVSFAIEYRESAESAPVFAGTIGLHSLQLGDHMAEIGYWMDSTFRGKGICTEALRMLSNFSITVMGFRRLEALADHKNLASQKVMENAGFHRDALLKNRATRRDGNQIDMVLYSMSSEA
jgi:RimJ/RimL family protein N-acetyltransferase